jgi:hypothetical protein
VRKGASQIRGLKWLVGCGVFYVGEKIQEICNTFAMPYAATHYQSIYGYKNDLTDILGPQKLPEHRTSSLGSFMIFLRLSKQTASRTAPGKALLFVSKVFVTHLSQYTSISNLRNF